MKKIPLTQGKFAIVDDENYDWLNQRKWSAAKNKHTYYAVRGDYTTGKRQTIFMHREVLGLKHKDGKIADHENHNGLDNQKCNVRVVTNRENTLNRKALTKGYYWNKDVNKWQAQICNNGKVIYLGLFNNERDAHKMYLCAKQKCHKIN